MDKIGSTVYLLVMSLGYVCAGFLLGSVWTLNHVTKG